MTGDEHLREEEPAHRPLIGAALAAASAVTLSVAVIALPSGHNPLPAVARYATEIALPKWHTTEPVNEVVYGTRGFDTFGETFLLLAAVLGVTTITRGREHRRGFIGEEEAGQRERAETDPAQPDGGDEASATTADAREESGRVPLTPDRVALGTPAPEQAAGMTVVVRGAVRTVTPILLIAGMYLAAWGYSPGGGFPAGAVVLGGVLLAYVGFGYPRIRGIVQPDVVEPLELAGALLVVAVEALGLVLKGSFSANWLPLGGVQTIRSGGVLQAFSGAELIEVATGLTLAIFGLLGMRHEWTDDADGDEPEGGAGR